MAGCDDGATAPSDGGLAISIAGLPIGVQATVSIAGPDGFSADLAETATLLDLRRGEYTITAGDVATDAGRFAAAPALQTLTISSGTVVADEIEYTVATARLTVEILGLPVGASPVVQVDGIGNQFRGLVTSTSTFAPLPPGSYTIVAPEISFGGRTYRPDPTEQTALLAASTTPTVATVAYGAGSGSLDLAIVGLPQGTAAAIDVTGPAGYSRTLTAATTLRHLEPGTYTVSASVVGSNLTTYTPAPASLTANVGDGASAASVSYQGAPLALRVEQVADGLTAPLFLDAPPGDPRLFVVERPGRVRVIENGAMLTTPFLDITSRVNFNGERGMLGMAFDPAYATNGRFFVYYVDLGGGMTLERFSSTPGSNVAGSSDGIVLAFPHGGSEHHGGTIAFGPDRMLYLGPGDGRCCGDPDNNAQFTFSLLGKILRLDVRTFPYVVPAMNPFVGRVDAREEIWAYGLRNPWRFSFDDESKLLFIGDVGQDLREEINVVSSAKAGLNYGWRLMEGSACYNPSTNCNPSGAQLTLPAHEYTHADGCSVTGGYVYRGAAIPELTGHYLYADYCRGWLRSFRVESGNVTDHRLWSGVSLPQVVSFGRDATGELYMIAGARVWRIVRG